MTHEAYCERCQETVFLTYPEIVSFTPDHGYQIELTYISRTDPDDRSTETYPLIGWAVTEAHYDGLGDDELSHSRTIQPVFLDVEDSAISLDYHRWDIKGQEITAKISLAQE